MKFFITDETNITKDTKFEFFVYGGIVVNENLLRSLSEEILNIKKEFGIKKERPIKWSNFNWKKQGELDPAVHTKIKDRVLDAVKKSDAKIIIYLTFHDFYHKYALIKDVFKFKATIVKDDYTKCQKYAINVCADKFNKYLEQIDDKGIMIADIFQSEHKNNLKDHAFDLFPDGIDRPMNNIVYPLIQIDNEYSHIHQVNDIVLGAITFSMREMEHNFLPVIKDNFLKDEPYYSTIFRNGINIYPKNIRTSDMQTKVDGLKAKFNRLMQI